MTDSDYVWLFMLYFVLKHWLTWHILSMVELNFGSSLLFPPVIFPSFWGLFSGLSFYVLFCNFLGHHNGPNFFYQICRVSSRQLVPAYCWILCLPFLHLFSIRYSMPVFGANLFGLFFSMNSKTLGRTARHFQKIL